VSGARDRRGIDRSRPQAYLLFCAANDRQLLLNLSAAPRRWPGRNPDSAGATGARRLLLGASGNARCMIGRATRRW